MFNSSYHEYTFCRAEIEQLKRAASPLLELLIGCSARAMSDADAIYFVSTQSYLSRYEQNFIYDVRTWEHLTPKQRKFIWTLVLKYARDEMEREAAKSIKELREVEGKMKGFADVRRRGVAVIGS